MDSSQTSGEDRIVVEDLKVYEIEPNLTKEEIAYLEEYNSINEPWNRVALTPKYPKQRLTAMLKNCRPAVAAAIRTIMFGEFPHYKLDVNLSDIHCTDEYVLPSFVQFALNSLPIVLAEDDYSDIAEKKWSITLTNDSKLHYRRITSDDLKGSAHVFESCRLGFTLGPRKTLTVKNIIARPTSITGRGDGTARVVPHCGIFPIPKGSIHLWDKRKGQKGEGLSSSNYTMDDIVGCELRFTTNGMDAKQLLINSLKYLIGRITSFAKYTMVYVNEDNQRIRQSTNDSGIAINHLEIKHPRETDTVPNVIVDQLVEFGDVLMATCNLENPIGTNLVVITRGDVQPHLEVERAAHELIAIYEDLLSQL